MSRARVGDRPSLPRPLRWLLRGLRSGELAELEDELLEMHRLRAARFGAEEADRWLRREARRTLLHTLLRRFRSRRTPGAARTASSARQRGDRLMDSVTLLRQAFRRVVGNPASTATIVLTVAVGLGGTTAAFGVVHGVLLEPLPYPEPNRIVSLHTAWPDGREWNLSVADFEALEERQTSYESVAAYDPNLFTLRMGEGAEELRAFEVTPGFFATLGIEPRLGRVFATEEGEPGAPGLAVLGHAFWRNRLGADEEVIGSSILLNEEPFTVIGVLAEEPGPLEYDSPFFLNLRLAPATRKGPFALRPIGRLRPGVSVEAARVEAEAINERIFPLWQDSWPEREATWGVRTLSETIVGEAGDSVWIPLGAVGLLLLIACTNAASLLVARGLRQRPEIAVRAAIGASRARIIRELTAESAIMAALGSAAGLGLALGGIRLTSTLGAGFIPRIHEIGLDGPVLAFFALVALGSLALFGLLPALQSSGGQLEREVASAGRGRASHLRAGRLRRVLVGAEFAIATPLLVGSVLLLVSLANLVRVDPGFDPDRLLTLRVQLPSSYDEVEAVRVFWRGLVEDVEALPGVERVGISDGRPPDEPGFGNNFVLEDHPLRENQSQPSVPWLIVSPGYFEALDVPLVDGRMFDHATDGRVALVDRAWAERFYPGESAVGRRFRHGGCTRPDCDPWHVIGVVENVRYEGIAEAGEGTMYLNRLQFPSGGVFLVIRTLLEEPLTLLPAVRGRVWEAEPGAPISRVATGRELVRESLQEPRYLTMLVGGFAAVALLLSLIGVYGVMAYFVQEHRRGIGIRLALGGAPASIVGFVLGNGLRLVLVGTGAGVLAGLAATRLLRSFLFEIDPADPTTFLVVGGSLLALAALACYGPARRAARIDPASLLREE